MSSVLDLVHAAMRAVGALPVGQNADGEAANNAIYALNSMLDSWRNERNLIYQLRDETLTMTGAASYTMGPSGNLDTVRPVGIESAYWRLNDADFQLRILDFSQYDALFIKNLVANYPTALFCEPTYPLATLRPWMIPTSGVLHMRTRQPLGNLALSDTLAFPPGYERAIRFNLAIEIANDNGLPVPPTVAKYAVTEHAAILRANAHIPLMSVECPGAVRGNGLPSSQAWRLG